MDNKTFQKILPIILILVAIILGGYLIIKKGLLPFPAKDKKENVVDIGKNSIVDLLFTGKEYKLSYGEMESGKLVDIAKFDKSEQWQGEGSVEENIINGGMTMSLVDRDGERSSAFLHKNLSLLDVDNIKFTANVKNDPDNIESLVLLFGNKEGTNFFRFPLTNLTLGVNNFSISKHRFSLVEGKESEGRKMTVNGTASLRQPLAWDKIERVQIDLISRPGTKASIEVGWIRAETDDAFSADWSWDNSQHFLNLYHTSEGKLALLVQNVGRSMGILKKVGSVKDFSYSSKVVSVKQGPVGLFFRGDYKTGYGYYLTVGGLGTSDWSISKYYVFEKQLATKVLMKGQIGNFEFTKDQPFFLKVNAKGNNITGYFSLDGKEYTKIGEVTDNEYSAGGIGVAVSSGGVGYFDDFYFSQK